MQQILKKLAKCFRHDNSVRLQINDKDLIPFAGKTLLVKVFAISKEERAKLK